MHTFLQLFNSSMEGATKRQNATTVIDCLDSSLVELVMPHFGNNCWTYLDAREAIIAKFGSEAFIASKKDAFMRIKFKDNVTIEEFANQFYYEAQILRGCGALTTFDAKIAMKYAIEPYLQLSVAMVQPLVGKCPIPDLVEILKRPGLQCGLLYPKKKSQYTKNSQSNAYQPHTTSSLASGSKPTFDNRGTSNNSNSVICRRCGGKGHYAT